MTTPPPDQQPAAETVEEIAERLAGAINHGAMDDRRQLIKDLLMAFANEIIRRAIEP